MILSFVIFYDFFCRTTVFVPFTNTWYDAKTQTEVASLLLFSQLERALSTSGLAGLDTLFAFMVAAELKVHLYLLLLPRSALKVSFFCYRTF